MKKDVIYIDIEDDITAIIGRVKNAGAPIVALVPPKRVGVLQSTVNLKLLQRAAEAAKRRIVLITNDQALIGLAAGLSIPIAKNLQSKPEIASIPVLEADDEDVINGEELPVGDLAATAPVDTTNAPTEEATESLPANKSDSAKKVKIPNFDAFRKKLFIFGGLGVLLVGFLVWAIFFAPAAKIVITSRTNVVNISKTLQLRSNAALDVNQGVLPIITNQTKKTASVDFEATGTKEVGEKATGAVKLSRQSLSATSVPTGTILTSSSGVAFATNSPVTIPASTVGGACFPTACPGTVNVDVTAVQRGSDSNGVSGNLSGAPGGATATLTALTAGGTDKTVTVVSSDDIAKAREQLKAQDANAVKAELKKLFGADQIVIEEGFVVDAAEPTSTPAVDNEATTAKLTAETTYTLIGVRRADLRSVYDAYLNTQLKGDTSQKIYESGDNATQFSQFVKTDEGYSVRATAVAQVGPNINDAQLAEQVKGMRVGEVRQLIEAIQGVKDVDVSLSPFWVNRVPNNVDRITVTFTLDGN